MTSNVVSPADHKASLPTRQAMPAELHCPPDPDVPAADKPQHVARSLINKAAHGDASAGSELPDRVEGKSLPGAPRAMIVQHT
jgi:hypothetical protein